MLGSRAHGLVLCGVTQACHGLVNGIRDCHVHARAAGQRVSVRSTARQAQQREQLRELLVLRALAARCRCRCFDQWRQGVLQHRPQACKHTAAAAAAAAAAAFVLAARRSSGTERPHGSTAAACSACIAQRCVLCQVNVLCGVLQGADAQLQRRLVLRLRGSCCSHLTQQHAAQLQLQRPALLRTAQVCSA
jgi:hypothetical protein